MAKKSVDIRPNYIEMKSADLAATKIFYSAAFGFDFTDYGPQYSCVEAGPISIGFEKGELPAVPMPIFETDDLEASLAAAQQAGAKIIEPIFAYPGGRRFECLDPSGNRIAVYQNEQH